MKAFILNSLFFIMLFNGVFALECKNPQHPVEKIICGDDHTLKLDKEFNTSYNNAMGIASEEEKAVLEQSVKSFLKARNGCENIYGLLESANDTINWDNRGQEEIYKVGRYDYPKGCITTWYNTINYALGVYDKHKNLISLPSYEEYAATFKKIVLKNGYPIIFDVSVPDKDIKKHNNIRATKVIYTFYFPKAMPAFAKKYNYFYYNNAGIPHGHSSYSENYIYIKDSDDNKPELLGGSSPNCSLFITNPMIINNQIYIPDNVSFTKIFGDMFGTYDNFVCYLPGKFNPDCMLKFKSLVSNEDNYFMFNREYWKCYEDPNDKKILRNNDCIFNILKKHADHTEKIKEIHPAPQQDCIFIKESKIEAVKQEFKGCLNSNVQ